MNDDNFLIGALLCAVFVIAVLWHASENTRLARELQKKTDAKTALWLVRFAWSRTVQLLMALACGIAVIIHFSQELADSRNSLDALTQAAEQRIKIETEQQVAQRKAHMLEERMQEEQNRQKAAAAAAAVVAPPAQPAVVPPVEDSPSQTERSRNNQAIDALYNPERSQTDRQSTMDGIKKRYEDIIVIYLFLKKCNRIRSDDFAIINKALQQEMAAVKAPAKLSAAIMSAAEGSYNEIYARSACNGSSINGLSAQYNDYIKTLAASMGKH